MRPPCVVLTLLGGETCRLARAQLLHMQPLEELKNDCPYLKAHQFSSRDQYGFADISMSWPEAYNVDLTPTRCWLFGVLIASASVIGGARHLRPHCQRNDALFFKIHWVFQCLID